MSVSPTFQYVTTTMLSCIQSMLSKVKMSKRSCAFLMSILSIVVINMFKATHAQADQASNLYQFARVLKEVIYPGLQDHFGDNKSWTAFDIPCTYQRTAGFHSWKWKYDGKISCAGLGEWTKQHCKSRGCAFKEPMKQYLTALAQRSLATKEELIAHIRNCNCGFNQGDINEMVASVNQG